jgi:Zn-dependent protease with chaperone function
MDKLAFASTVTLGLLAGMVVGVVLAAMVAAGEVHFTLAIAITIVFNALIWFVSPWITDLTLRWFNKLQFLSDDELKQRYPGVHGLIHAVATEHGFSAPSVGIIPDKNPTAFTYGRLQNNARIVVTEGIFEFLNEDETKAVVAHELGHIVHRDFIVMTIAGTLVQILYQLYAALIRAGRGDNKKGAPLVAIAITSLAFYYLGLYIVLYLSRTREYYADAFSADRIEARHLASALVKIAYGIVKTEDTEATQTLLQSTRHMGVVDVKNARQLGLLTEGELAEPARAAEAMLFDNFNPWSHIIELNSTHPLTGRRIAHLETIAQQKGQTFAGYDMKAAAQRVRLDTGYLWRKFWREIALYFVPVIAFAAAVLVGAWKFAPAAAALGVIATLRVRFPSGSFPVMSVADLMSDPAASPVVGRPARLDGKAIGRVNPGFFAGEDVIYQDRTGLLPVDFRSMLGFIGDFFAGWKRVPKHIGEEGNVTGWFRRSMGGYIILKEMNSTKGQLRARPYFWQMLLSIIVIVANVYIVLAVPAATRAGLFEQPSTVDEEQHPEQ